MYNTICDIWIQTIDVYKHICKCTSSTHQLEVYVSIHSYKQLFMYPWGYTKAPLASTANAIVAQAATDAINSFANTKQWVLLHTPHPIVLRSLPVLSLALCRFWQPCSVFSPAFAGLS